MQGRQRLLLAAAALVAVLVPGGWAIAQSAGGDDDLTELQSSLDAVTRLQERVAIMKFCDGSVQCTVVNGYADPTASESGARTTLGALLAESGKPASACGEAESIYRSAGLQVDAFAGPCPTTAEAEAAVAAAGGNLAPSEQLEPPGSH